MLDGIWYRWHTQSPEDSEAAPSVEPEDPLDAVPLVLKSTDGETVRTRYGIIKQSTTLVDLVEAQGRNPNLSQPIEVQLDTRMLRGVVKWCDFHRGYPPLKLEMHPVRRRYDQFYLNDEERSYFDEHYLVLWELAAAADYLNVSRLYYASCMTLYLLAKNHCWMTYKLIQAMGWYTRGREVSAKCHVVPRNVSISIYCDVRRFDDDENECYYIFRKYGGYFMKLGELHSAALPPQLRQAHIDAMSDEDVAYTATLQLSRFALADIYVHTIDDDHVLASLRQFLVKPTSVACETPNIQGFSLGEQRFLQQIAVVLGFVETLRHVEKLKMKLTPRQLIAFLPEAVDFKLPPHISFRIKVKNNDEDKIDDYDAAKWLQLMLTIDRMHENAIRIRLRLCTLAPAMLRTLYEHYLNAEKPTGVQLILEPHWNQGLQRDVEPITAQLGLRLVRKERESRLYESTARRGHKFTAQFVTHWCDACVYSGLTLHIIKDSA